MIDGGGVATFEEAGEGCKGGQEVQGQEAAGATAQEGRKVHQEAGAVAWTRTGSWSLLD